MEISNGLYEFKNLNIKSVNEIIDKYVIIVKK
jgi:hypothetical protein